MIGLRPCFNVSDTQKVKLPEMTLHFKGRAEVVLPLENYFVLAGDTAVCLAVVTGGVTSLVGKGGSAVILGNFQRQNFYVEYDLKNEGIGLRQQESCS
ncbi:putative aspartyl protease [Camellia lanceoleosa]|uniref:Aspartyl protease n=1 Tax=Camellia lanceoleosa TaxID=1840588 RepID=A0ACC0F532_9ERIC|nr:putative aspartyl protease [Camellia lanceoleosa]